MQKGAGRFRHRARFAQAGRVAGPASGLATQQGQDILRQGVGLGKHRGASLLQDLGASQVGRFCCEVGILDAAT